MRARSAVSDDAFWVYLSGKVAKHQDFPVLQAELDKELGSGTVYLDLSEVEFLGSAFVDFLIRLRNRQPGLAARIKIVNVPGIFLEILQLVGIDQAFTVKRTV